MFKSSTWLIQCDYCRFSIMMKYGFIDMDHFYIAAFVASSKLNDLSQNASNVVSRVVLPHSCIWKEKYSSADLLVFFTSPKNGTHFTRGRGVNSNHTHLSIGTKAHEDEKMVLSCLLRFVVTAPGCNQARTQLLCVHHVFISVFIYPFVHHQSCLEFKCIWHLSFVSIGPKRAV